MKNKITIISLSIVLVALLLGVLIKTNNKEEAFQQDGVTYALKVDGTSSTSFPSKGMYKVSTECENATCKWDYDNWKLYIENITGNVTCDIEFNTITKTYLNNKIIGLSGTEQGTGQVLNEKGYRYEGKDPNNYIWFNNESWRIIGVFDASSHGQTGQNLVKIIRENSIGGLAWYKTSKTDWSTSSLKALLNGAYYNADNGTGGEYCYGSESRVPANCDYRQIGIQSNYRPMIKNVIWYLGTLSGNNSATNYRVTIVDNYYKYERGDTVYSENPKSDTGYIGLMYPSDYGYSVLASSCARTTNLNSYNTAACAGQNWLYGQGIEWTITPFASSDTVFHVYYGGDLGFGKVYDGFAVRPTLYLDSSVYVLDGDGSRLNPYIIGM